MAPIGLPDLGASASYAPRRNMIGVEVPSTPSLVSATRDPFNRLKSEGERRSNRRPLERNRTNGGVGSRLFRSGWVPSRSWLAPLFQVMFLRGLIPSTEFPPTAAARRLVEQRLEK
jgi:hypothetical protein